MYIYIYTHTFYYIGPTSADRGLRAFIVRLKHVFACLHPLLDIRQRGVLSEGGAVDGGSII